jgi:hypothetical protein
MVRDLLGQSHQQSPRRLRREAKKPRFQALALSCSMAPAAAEKSRGLWDKCNRSLEWRPAALDRSAAVRRAALRFKLPNFQFALWPQEKRAPLRLSRTLI